MQTFINVNKEQQQQQKELLIDKQTQKPKANPFSKERTHTIYERNL